MFSIDSPKKRAYVPALVIFLRLLSIGAYGGMEGAEKSHAQDNEIVNLPEYKVVQKVTPETWTYVSSGNIEIISNAGDRYTKDIVGPMLSKIEGMETIAPSLREETPFPFYVIIHKRGITRNQLYGKTPAGEGWNKYKGYLETNGILFIFLEREESLVAGLNAGGTRVAGYFRRVYDRREPALPGWHKAGLLGAVGLIRYYKNFIYLGGFDYYHDNGKVAGEIIISPPLNRWLLTSITDARLGLSEWRYISRDEPGLRRGTTWAADEDSGALFKSNEMIDIRDRREREVKLDVSGVVPLAQRVKVMPMRVFLNTEEGHPLLQRYPGGLWRLQAYTFWHYCRIRRDAGKLKEGYDKLVARASDSMVTEEMFRECMGMGFDDMTKALQAYVGEKRARDGYDFNKIYMDPTKPPLNVKLRPATPAEVARIKGEALSALGRYDLARQTMLTVYDRKKADPALCASMGVLEYNAGDLEKARPLLTVAMRAKVRNAGACRIMARLWLDDARGAKKEGRVDGERAVEIYELLSRARGILPSSETTYSLLAELLACSDVKPTAEQVGMLREGLKRFPDDASLEKQCAQFVGQ